MDALNELAAAMGNDPNFAATITNALALKAPLASPVLTGDPKAPTASAGDNDTSIATTGFVRLAMGLFGIGTDTTTLVGDANSVALSGMYRLNADATAIPIAANSTLLQLRYNDGGAAQLLAALSGTGGLARLFWRTQAAGGWTVWREVGGLDSPVFTGKPQVPTPETNSAGNQAVNQNFVREWGRKFIGSGIAVTTATYKIDPASFGNWFNVVVPNAVVTLPEAGLVAAGKTLVVRNNAGLASISLVSSESISAGVSGKTFILNPYEIVELAANGDSYWVVDRGLMTAAAGLDSPVFVGDPRAPTAAIGDSDTSIATTEFVQLTAAASGVGTNIGVYSTDLNTATSGGFYRTNSATLNTPVQNNLSVLTSPYNNGGCMQIATLLSVALGRLYLRTQAGGTWSPWREIAAVDSPAFTGKPTAPTPALGTQTDQVATTDFVARLIGERDVGTVFYTAGSSAPRGALKANGAAVSRTTYAALFAVIGTDYGAGDGSSTFNLPDQRGEFIRGWDDGRGVDASRVRGSAQGGQISSHSHNGTALTAGVHSHTVSYRRDRAPAGDGNAVCGDEAYYDGEMLAATTAEGAHVHTLSITATGGNEVRPRNIAHLACIYY
ncbi:tail fiber protein [Pseudomonas avellanae]|uniref:tail fiber protein n=2 Tax=Pseudomonas avellanae TaxID=46257 RepID=UPI0039E1610E